ncbi:MAG: metallophosphoesterase [Bacteroidales bacterium]|nr:metallophosphoesterase [Bacteroidales bacterium]
MKIQYASDLHLEFADNWRYLKENPIKVTGDVLVLAGDIGYLGDDNYTKHPFWDWASENYQQVICCMGNHEFYKYFDIATLEDGYSLEIRHNVHSYYNAVVRIKETDFIISTLWSEIPLKEADYTEQVISDFRRILFNGGMLTFADFNREHKRCLNFIKETTTKSQAKYKIVVTHHVPSFQMQCPKFADSPVNGAFTVELQAYIENSGIDFWIFGHSHYNVDKVIGKTTCLSNQLGYVNHNEHKSFDFGKYVMLDK